MSLPKTRDAPGVLNAHGHLCSPPRAAARAFGTVVGLRQRLARWQHDLGANKTWPWVGLGLIQDLEVAVQLLDLREFAEWLRTKGDPAHAGFALDILADQETLEAVRQAVDTAGYPDQADPVKAVEMLDAQNRTNEADAKVADDMRQVLIETGALAADDTSTPLPDLLRMLLS